MQTDLGAQRIDLLVVILLEIDDSGFAKGRYRISRLRIQRDQTITGRDVENAFLFAICPVREAAARKLTGSRGATRAFVLSMKPEKLAGSGIEGHNVAARSGCGVKDAVRHERRAFHIRFGPGTQILGMESPGEMQLVEITCVNLTERRVFRVSQIGAVGMPFAVLRASLRDSDRNEQTRARKGS